MLISLLDSVATVEVSSRSVSEINGTTFHAQVTATNVPADGLCVYHVGLEDDRTEESARELALRVNSYLIEHQSDFESVAPACVQDIMDNQDLTLDTYLSTRKEALVAKKYVEGNLLEMLGVGILQKRPVVIARLVSRNLVLECQSSVVNELPEACRPVNFDPRDEKKAKALVWMQVNSQKPGDPNASLNHYVKLQLSFQGSKRLLHLMQQVNMECVTLIDWMFYENDARRLVPQMPKSCGDIVISISTCPGCKSCGLSSAEIDRRSCSICQVSFNICCNTNSWRQQPDFAQVYNSVDV